MSYARIVHNISPLHHDLLRRLTKEWRDPQEGIKEPIIIEESERQQAPTHLYVIWNEWSSLSQNDRSEIILDAYEQAKGRNFALNVTVAMGLTSQEAQRMGIEYAPLETAA